MNEQMSEQLSNRLSNIRTAIMEQIKATTAVSSPTSLTQSQKTAAVIEALNSAIICINRAERESKQ